VIEKKKETVKKSKGEKRDACQYQLSQGEGKKGRQEAARGNRQGRKEG